MKHIVLVTFFSIFFSVFNLNAQSSEQNNQIETPLTRILFVFDASLSMYGRFDGQPKIDIAQKVMSETLDSLKTVPNLQLALRIYGNRSKITNTFQDCDDTHLEVPFAEDNTDQMKHVLKITKPMGTTPIAKSLEETINDFPPCSNCRNIIILITDGIEACDGDPCAVAKALRTHNIYLKPFVIGLGVLEEYRAHFYCIGSYFDANSRKEFKSVLQMVVDEALSTTSVQLNLLDILGHPSETNVGFTLYNRSTGLMKYNYVHTLNYNGLPDTLNIDPTLTYDLTVHTLPKVSLENISIKLNQHNTINVETPQGSLDFKVAGGNQQFGDVDAVVYYPNSCERINHQKLNQKIKYLVGTYDLEILTLPSIKTTIEIAQSKNTEIKIPQPGNLAIKSNAKGFGAIYHIVDGKATWIAALDNEQTSHNFKLLPGQYKVVYRPINANRTIYSVEKDFTIISGKSVLVNL